MISEPPDRDTDGAPDRDLVAALRREGLRATPQRRAILAAFEGGAAEHLSAEEIHARASARVAGLGRGTVYATLADLAEAGLLGAVGDQDPVRYETNTAAHDHFRCRLCLRLFDVDLPAVDTAGLAKHGYAVESVAAVAEGVCKECRDYGRGLAAGAKAMARDAQLDAATVDALSCVRFDSDIGPIVVGASADGIVRVAFPGHADFASLEQRARARRGGRTGRDAAEALSGAIRGYLGGERAPLEGLVDWARIGDRGRVGLEATQRVAWGTRRSYHQVCDRALDPYTCGFVFGTNPAPILFPCHRVTRGSEIVAEYVGGTTMRDQLDLLEHPTP